MPPLVLKQKDENFVFDVIWAYKRPVFGGAVPLLNSLFHPVS